MAISSVVTTEGQTILEEWYSILPQEINRVYFAVGSGDAAWDTTPVAPVVGDTVLEAEVARVKPCWWGYLDETAYAQGKILWSQTQTSKFRLVADFDGKDFDAFHDGGRYIRELGIFFEARSASDSGSLVILFRKSRVWWASKQVLRQEIILDITEA